MFSDEENDSIWLFDVLDIIGANDEFRKTCQRVHMIEEILLTFQIPASTYICGSSWEGSFTPAWNNTCQINDAEPMGNKDGLIESVGNSFIAASSLPKELAGPCKGHDCKVNEVCIPQNPTYACVKLLEVFVEMRTREGSLVSQFKKTGQSTCFICAVYETGAGVDGIKDPTNFFHTDSELEPFWWVNLGQVYKIQKVVSTNRIGNCCGDRIRKMLVHVGKSEDTSHMELCGQFLGPAVSGQVIVIKCCTFLEGQIVKLTSVNNEPTFFHLTEVEVYGF